MKVEAAGAGTDTISKESGLCAAEKGDAATVRAFLEQLLLLSDGGRVSPAPECPREDGAVTDCKPLCSSRVREVVTAVLETAIENGQTKVVEQLLASPELSERLRTAMPARWEQQLLLQAIHADHIDIVACLLAHGTDPNASMREEDPVVEDDDRLPLCAAVALGSLEIAQLLVASGADVNARCDTRDRCAPVFTAACRDEPDILSLLLRSSDAVDADARHPATLETALHVAAKRGHITCVATLLASRRASVNALNRAGSSALQLARTQCGDARRAEVVRLLEEADENPRKHGGQ